MIYPTALRPFRAVDSTPPELNSFSPFPGQLALLATPGLRDIIPSGYSEIQQKETKVTKSWRAAIPSLPSLPSVQILRGPFFVEGSDSFRSRQLRNDERFSLIPRQQFVRRSRKFAGEFLLAGFQRERRAEGQWGFREINPVRFQVFHHAAGG